MPLYSSTTCILLFYLSTMYSILFLKFIFCQLGIIVLCICSMLVLRNKNAHFLQCWQSILHLKNTTIFRVQKFY